LADALVEQKQGSRRDRIANLLIQLGPEAVPASAARLCADPPADAALIEGILLRIGVTAPSSITELLHESDPTIREVASNVVVTLGAIAEDSVIELLQDPMVTAQNAAAAVLGRMQVTDPGPVMGLLLSGNPRVRQVVGEKIEALGDQAIPALIEALQSPHERLSKQAGALLGEMGEAAVDALLILLRHDSGSASAHVHVAAIRTLGEMGDVRATDRLLVASGSQHAKVRATALEAIGRLGPEAVPLLLEAFEDASHPAPAAVIAAMGRVGDELVLPALIATLENADEALRDAAVEALADYGPSASGVLNDALAEDSYWTRKAAGEVMRRWQSGRGHRAPLL
jgi:HEAT repeat protein